MAMFHRILASRSLAAALVLLCCVQLALPEESRSGGSSGPSRPAKPAWRGDDSVSGLIMGEGLRDHTKNWLKDQLRWGVLKLFGPSSPDPKDAPKYGLKLDPDWQKAPLDHGMLLLIHGYQSTPEEHGSILHDARKLGVPCGYLRYPNDQPIAKSAALLAQELTRVRDAQPDRPLTLLGLSMGGLVSRAVIEDPKLDPGNVRRLIMVATPNQGSNLARFSLGADLWEFLVKSQDKGMLKRALLSVEDGLGEAADDLKPGSRFLTQLNARERNAKVEYQLFLGTGAPLDEKSLETLRRFVAQRGEGNGFTRALQAQAALLLEDADEIVAGKGDGGVAVKRGRLEGVKETVVLGFRHTKLMDGNDEASRKLREELLTRIRPSGR
jgi:pimeloyl-ACP methyl ester carboxylesterase